ncbi:acyl-CoA thioesterase/BAAT N-terminal domain-containing protein [Alkalihalobacillus pseudalcaliphilus]|uniref:acyl-CoA thioesterase/BAAT N-terminal domain-containing protein n=1 Tax=Alkalihalobacillus pseudalcaliphilus TaxID=79884 RepID=UPI00064DE2C7|nr:acyl-CoA thioesterase/BAAT N-terminal domain-containing protein [Alkalihalobacillus pseudalcaliphilus]KMK76783.1 hypothetical protein AB990_07670 [Alkalihalobacillus pseudalcaliphilus]
MHIKERNNRWVTMLDEVIHIYFTNLQPHNTYKIELDRRSVTAKDVLYRQSYAYFQADKNGEIHLSEMAPIEGTYKLVDPMGLFWSMALIKKEINASEPYDRLAPHVFTLSIYHNNVELERKELQKRWYADEEVAVIPIHDSVIGNYYYHLDGKPRPGLIVVSGSEGGTNDFTASHLTQYGYNVLAVAYFGVEGLNSRLANIPLEIIRDSISWLQKREDVKNGWMGMHGVSRGAELALWSGVLFDEIKAIVSLNGSGVSFAGITPWTEEPNLLPAWMYKGEALPYATAKNPVETALLCKEKFLEGKNALSFWYETLYEQHPDKDGVKIPIVNTNKDYLFIAGKEDAIFDSCTYSDFFSGEHIKKHFYEKAGHGIAIPHLPAFTGEYFGGEKPYTYHASLHSWSETIAFLEESRRKYKGLCHVQNN